jgi:glycosyl-4,4'-diaponeurosporenoate acyltransferase
MRLFEFNTFITVILDFVAWFIIHMSVAHIMLRVPPNFFNCRRWIYIERNWEGRGNIYQRILKVKKWKPFLPDGAEFSKNKGFPKRHLQSRTPDYLEAFLVETCRAELTHWVTMLFAPLFFLWNFFFVGWIMILYALITNMPFIIVQRFNRFRLIRVLSKP